MNAPSLILPPRPRMYDSDQIHSLVDVCDEFETWALAVMPKLAPLPAATRIAVLHGLFKCHTETIAKVVSLLRYPQKRVSFRSCLARLCGFEYEYDAQGGRRVALDNTPFMRFGRPYLKMNRHETPPVVEAIQQEVYILPPFITTAHKAGSPRESWHGQVTSD